MRSIRCYITVILIDYGGVQCHKCKAKSKVGTYK